MSKKITIILFVVLMVALFIREATAQPSKIDYLYFPEGRLRKEVDREKNVIRLYNSQGVMIRQLEMIEMGKDLKLTEFDSDGKEVFAVTEIQALKEKYTYETNGKTGKVKGFFEDIDYNNGEILSVIKYFPDGTVQAEKRFKNSRKNGWQNIFHENGAKWIEQLYKDGYLISSKMYSENKRMTLMETVDDEKHEVIEYFEDGKIKSEVRTTFKSRLWQRKEYEPMTGKLIEQKEIYLDERVYPEPLDPDEQEDLYYEYLKKIRLDIKLNTRWLPLCRDIKNMKNLPVGLMIELKDEAKDSYRKKIAWEENRRETVFEYC